MSRRRYLSTDISRDKRVAQLAERAGPVAALLYTWSIPHAADDGTIVSDPEEFLSEVAPNLVTRGQATVLDAERCIEVGLELGLFASCANGLLRFPESFYKHQTYIRGDRRGTPEPEPPSNGAAAQIGANQRKSAQNVASFKSSSSSPVKSSSTSESVRPREGVTEDFKQKLEDEFCEQLGSRETVRAHIDAALAHTSRLKYTDDHAYLRRWLRDDANKASAGPPGRNGRPEPVRHIKDNTGLRRQGA